MARFNKNKPYRIVKITEGTDYWYEIYQKYTNMFFFKIYVSVKKDFLNDKLTFTSLELVHKWIENKLKYIEGKEVAYDSELHNKNNQHNQII